MLKTPIEKLNELKFQKLTAEKLQSNIGVPKNFMNECADKMLKHIYDEAYDDIFRQMKEKEPDTPDEIIRAFINTCMYIDIEYGEYDLKTKNIECIAIPRFRDVDDIITDTPEAKLLDEWVMKQ